MLVPVGLQCAKRMIAFVIVLCGMVGNLLSAQEGVSTSRPATTPPATDTPTDTTAPATPSASSATAATLADLTKAVFNAPRYAVVMGINDYADDGINDLSLCEKDAQAVYDLLIDPAIGGVPKQNATLLLGAQATASGMRLALSPLGKIPQHSVVFVYYSGHGMKEGNEAFWVTQDALKDNLAGTALSDTDVQRYLKLIPSDRVIVMIDACYAAATTKNKGADLSDSLKKFTGQGRAILSAAGDGEEAIEAADLEHSVFTYYLLQGLRGAADVNTDGVLVLPEIMNYLDDQVADAARKRKGVQRPVVDLTGVREPAKFSVVIDAPRLQVLATATVEAQQRRAARTKALKELALDDVLTIDQFKEAKRLLELDPTKLSSLENLLLVEYGRVLDGELPPNKLAKALELARSGNTSRGFVGVVMASVSQENADQPEAAVQPGVLVEQVVAASPAEQAGVVVGDVILSLNGVATPDPDTLLSTIERLDIGTTYALEVLRDGQQQTLQITIAERSNDAENVPAIGTTSELTDKQVAEIVKLMERGKQRHENKDYVGAILDFTSVWEQDPTHLEALVERATSKWALSILNSAGYDLKLAIAINPNYGPALLKRAEICASQMFENRDEGERNATQAIAAGIPQGYSFRGGLRRRCGLFDEAIQDYSAYLKSAPKDTYANVNRGFTRILQGDYPAAIEDISLDFSAPPPHPSGYLWRGMAYALLGKAKTAKEDYAKQLELFPEDDEFVAKSQKIVKLLEATEPENASEFVARAVKLNELGEPNFAIADLKRALIVDEESVAAYTTLGQILSEQQFYDRSAETYARAAELSANDAELVASSALAYYYGKRYEQGLETCALGLEIHPGHGRLINLKGLCLYALGRYREAAVEHLACSRILVNDAVVLSNLADNYMDMREIDRAIETYSRALAISPKHIYALRLRAQCYRMIGKFVQARADMNAAMKAASTPDSYNLVLMAEIELAAKQPDAAMKLLKQALEMDGRYSDAYRWVAVAEDMRGNTKEAMKAIDTALQWYVGSATIHGTRALLRLKNGNKEGAERDLKYASLMEPRLAGVVARWPARFEKEGLVNTLLRPEILIRAKPVKPKK